MFITRTVCFKQRIKNPYFLKFNHNTFKVNRFSNCSRYNASNSANLKLKTNDVTHSIPSTTKADLPLLARFIRTLVKSNKQQEALELWVDLMRCDIFIDPFTSCTLFVGSNDFNTIVHHIKGNFMRYSSIYGNNPLLRNISKRDRVDQNWKLYCHFKSIGFKVDTPLQLYIISQLCLIQNTPWDVLRRCINRLKSCGDFTNKDISIPIDLINSWIKLLIDTESFDMVSLLLEEFKPDLNLRTYQLLIYPQSDHNMTLFPHYGVLFLAQRLRDFDFKITPPIATRVLSYLHNKGHHKEFLDWIEVLRDQSTRIPKFTLNKIITELGQQQYYSIIIRIWKILSQHPDPFNNHLITTILNAFSNANNTTTDEILTNIITTLKDQNIPLSTSIFNVLMKHSNLKNQPHLTDLYFQQIQENNLKLTAYSYNLMIKKSYKLNDLTTIEGIYELAKTKWFKPNELTWQWFIDIYKENGNNERLEEILELIPDELIKNSLKLAQKIELINKDSIKPKK